MGTTRDGSTRVIMRQRSKASKAEDHIKRAPCVRRPLFPLRVAGPSRPKYEGAGLKQSQGGRRRRFRSNKWHSYLSSKRWARLNAYQLQAESR